MPSAPGMSASAARSMFYHEPGEAPGQPGRQGSGQGNPLGDSVASLTQSRDAGFPAGRRVRSPTREHRSVPSTVQEDLPSSSSAAGSQPGAPMPRAPSSGPSGAGGSHIGQLGARSSSGNPFMDPDAPVLPTAQRKSFGNPFAPPEDDPGKVTNPFKNQIHTKTQ